MKILHVIDSGGLYGAEIMLLNLVDEQIKLGLKPVIASIGEKNIQEKPIETEAMKRGFAVVNFKMIPGPNIAGALKILRFAKNEKFNLIHSHGYKGNILFGFIPRFVRRMPLVSTLHGWTSTSGLSKIKIYEWLDSLSLKYIDAIVLVNKEMLNNPKLKRKKRINYKVINNGIPLQEIRRTEPNAEVEGFCKAGFTIGTIGRLSAEKGYNYLIEALSQISKERIDMRLVIIGEGPERNKLEGLVKKYDLIDRVLMPGYKENARQYIPCFNVYAISSLTEGLPITLLEAMQAKVPIVATNVGGISNVLDGGKVGLLVPPRKKDELVKAICRIYTDKKVSDPLIKSAYYRQTKYFSSETMAIKYFNVYRTLLQS